MRASSTAWVAVALATLTGCGASRIRRLPESATESLILTVTIAATARSVDEVATEVTAPLEEALASLPGLRHMESHSRGGVAVLTLDFAPGAAVRSAVAERLAGAAAKLPPDTDPPVLSVPGRPGSPAFAWTLRGDLTGEALRAIADHEVRPRLERVPGTAEVVVAGGAIPELAAHLDPARLAAYGTTIAEVVAAIGAHQVEVPGGRRADPGVRGLGNDSLSDLGEVVVATRDGVPIRLRDLAMLEAGAARGAGAAIRDGVPCVLGLVHIRKGAPATATAAAIRECLTDATRGLPPAVRLEPLGPPLLSARAAGAAALPARALVAALRDVKDVASAVVHDYPRGGTEVLLGLAPQPSRPIGETAREIAERLAATAPGGAPWDLRTLDASLPPDLRPLTLRVHGPEIEVLRRLATRLAERVRAVPGVRGACIDDMGEAPALIVRPDTAALAKLGIPARALALTVAAARGGTVAGRVFDSRGRRRDIVVRVPGDSIPELLLRGAGGDLVPVSRVAAMEEAAAPVEIRREDRERFIDVKIDQRGALPDVRERIAAAAAALPDLPAGYGIRQPGGAASR